MTSKLKFIILIGLTCAVAFILFSYIQEKGLLSFHTPATTYSDRLEDKTSASLTKVLDKTIGSGLYYISVKVVLNTTTEESEQLILTPLFVTLNQVVSFTPSKISPTLPKPPEKPASSVTRKYPGFSMFNNALNTTPKDVISEPQQAEYPLKEQASKNLNVYYNQNKTKRVTPTTAKNKIVNVVIDSRRIDLLKLDKNKFKQLLIQVGNLDINTGDQLHISTYRFSDTLFGFDKFYLDFRAFIKKQHISPILILSIGAALLALLLATYVGLKLSRHNRNKEATFAEKSSKEAKEQAVLALRQEKDFQKLCQELVKFVEKNTAATADIVVEIITAPTETNGTSISPLKKVSVFLLFLQSENAKLAQALLTEMGESMAKIVLHSLQEFWKVESHVVASILKEFYQILVQKKALIAGPTLSRKLFKNTFGNQVEEKTNTLGFSFQFLDKVDDTLLLSFLNNDHPEFTALLLTVLDEHKAADILSKFPLEKSLQLSQLMLEIENPCYSLIGKLALDMESKLFAEEISSDSNEKLLRLSRVLEKVNASVRNDLMKEMDLTNKETAHKLRTLIYTFEDLISLSDDHLKMVLGEFEIKELATALLHCSEPLKEKFYTNLSTRAKEGVTESVSILQDVPAHKVEHVQYKILKLARKLAYEGKIIFEKSEQPL
jgi:flagellar motor switch protein FliG